ncbi:hypothetical protein F5146DRAFT_1130955 [Armillaria mellea]|nr:hypothetical protein F5146DRAFT_1130955 [Armillaria mellea]
MSLAKPYRPLGFLRDSLRLLRVVFIASTSRSQRCLMHQVARVAPDQKITTLAHSGKAGDDPSFLDGRHGDWGNTVGHLEGPIEMQLAEGLCRVILMGGASSQESCQDCSRRTRHFSYTHTSTITSSTHPAATAIHAKHVICATDSILYGGWTSTSSLRCGKRSPAFWGSLQIDSLGRQSSLKRVGQAGRTHQGEYDYDPFAFDVALLGYLFFCRFQHLVTYEPMLAPLLDEMITRTVSRRFTASEALQFLEELLPGVQLDTPVPSEWSNRHYEKYNRWNDLSAEFTQKWSTYQEMPVSCVTIWL